MLIIAFKLLLSLAKGGVFTTTTFLQLTPRWTGFGYSIEIIVPVTRKLGTHRFRWVSVRLADEPLLPAEFLHFPVQLHLIMSAATLSTAFVILLYCCFGCAFTGFGGWICPFWLHPTTKRNRTSRLSSLCLRLQLLTFHARSCIVFALVQCQSGAPCFEMLDNGSNEPPVYNCDGRTES